MLKFARRVRFRDDQRWRRVETRLRDEADAARRRPARDLRRRTLAALREASLELRPASRRERQGWVTLAAAGVGLAVVASVAVTQRGAPLEQSRPTQRVDAPADTTVHTAEADGDRQSRFAIVIGLDTSRFEAAVQRQMERMEGSWAEPLLDEARQIVDDARAAGELVATLLLVPSVRIERGDRGGAG